MSNPYKDEVEKIFAIADIRFNGTRPHDIQVKDERFYKRFLKETRLALGESYMDGWWECEDLFEMFFRLFTAPIKEKLDTKNIKFILANIKAKLIPLGSITNSKHIGPDHYDHGNTLYRYMLGETLQYSCGYWKGANNLDEAQINKMELTCRKLKLEPGMKVLDVGCGWGVLAKHMAEKYKVSVVGITMSKEQLAFGQKICEHLPVELRYQDYRDVKEKFDRVVSVGMMCHVGVPYFRAYMESVHSCLNDNGLFVLHHIATNESKWSNLWLDKYIFPGAKPPSAAETTTAADGLFVVENIHNLGVHYYYTMNAWYQNFVANWDKIKDKYDERFYRMWKYYLASVGAGFKVRKISLIQTVLSKNGEVDGYGYGPGKEYPIY